MKREIKSGSEVNRRNFLRGSSVATVMAMMGGIPLRAEEKAEPETKRGLGPPINCALIGCGARGREILAALAKLMQKTEDGKVVQSAPVLAICDTYAAAMRRAKENAPKAEGCADYKQILANKDVQAVFVATPTHLHKQIVLDALAAGKHVYCEAPLSHTVEDARMIARAAQAAPRSNFQAGLQMRSDKQSLFLWKFMRSDSAGTFLKARAQWHLQNSWRRTAPTPEREKELNWRLSRATSPGLMGEVGLHQVDLVNWFFNARPVAVTGFGGLLQWKDEPDRETPDTIQAVFEYPSGATLSYEATLGNSYDAEYTTFYGVYSAILCRSGVAWMFKEVNAPMLGWEVYARKQELYQATGLILKTGSSKQEFLAAPLEEVIKPAKDELSQALESFLSNSNTILAGIEDFQGSFGEKAKGLEEHLAKLRKAESWMHAADGRKGFEATVIALKANEAIQNKQRVVYQEEWFKI